MEKEIVERREFVSNYISFEGLIEEMVMFKKHYPNGTNFCLQSDAVQEYEDMYAEIKFTCEDFETDDEFEARCEREENNKQQALKRKREELERLKKELGEE